jgi:membrane protease YdiL (CAAX protease family)
VFLNIFFNFISSRIPLRPVRSIVIANVVFGAIHLANLYGSRFSAEYISLQIVMGVLVGTFYSTRFFLSQSLWEPLVMHLINNVLSRFRVSFFLASAVTLPVHSFVFSHCSLLPLHFELEISNYSVIVPRTFDFIVIRVDV